jgi:hypothetical protein
MGGQSFQQKNDYASADTACNPQVTGTRDGPSRGSQVPLLVSASSAQPRPDVTGCLPCHAFESDTIDGFHVPKSLSADQNHNPEKHRQLPPVSWLALTITIQVVAFQVLHRSKYVLTFDDESRWS